MEEDSCLPLLWQWSEKIRAENARGLFHSSHRKKGKKVGSGVGMLSTLLHNFIFTLPTRKFHCVFYAHIVKKKMWYGNIGRVHTGVNFTLGAISTVFPLSLPACLFLLLLMGHGGWRNWQKNYVLELNKNKRKQGIFLTSLYEVILGVKWDRNATNQLTHHGARCWEKNKTRSPPLRITLHIKDTVW